MLSESHKYFHFGNHIYSFASIITYVFFGWKTYCLELHSVYIYRCALTYIHAVLPTSIHPSIHPSIHTYIHTYIFMYVCLHKCIYTCIDSCMSSYILTCMHIHICMDTQIHNHACLPAYTYIYRWKYTYID